MKLVERNGHLYAHGFVKDTMGNTHRIRRSTGFTVGQKTLAKERMREIFRDAGKKADLGAKTTVADAIKLYLGSRSKLPGSTDIVNLRLFENEFGHGFLCSLGQAEVMDYFKGRGNKDNSVSREMTSIKSMINYNNDMGRSVPTYKLKQPTSDDARVRWLTERERDRMIVSARVCLQPILRFLFYSGARLGEAFNLRARDVETTCVVIVSRKGGRTLRRKVPVHFVTYISDYGFREFKSNDDIVFRSDDYNSWNKYKFYKYFNEALEKADIEDFNPHDCRHTFASHLVQKGASLRAVADLLGHTSLDMVMRYSHLAPSHLHDTVNLINKPKED